MVSGSAPKRDKSDKAKALQLSPKYSRPPVGDGTFYVSFPAGNEPLRRFEWSPTSAAVLIGRRRAGRQISPASTVSTSASPPLPPYRAIATLNTTGVCFTNIIAGRYECCTFTIPALSHAFCANDVTLWTTTDSLRDLGTTLRAFGCDSSRPGHRVESAPNK
ncbi:hypothetical protein HPB50_016971 [Hyalomma asiaticum]|uniref:Uncharacterized protein n=1 Tax=Hyalomma asiaticum TaxID=266040 RepID=A0ACB7RQE4_HYAAI|nr:hypothetical protein HPB50_016971 [Hyalomma asiaticum]